MNVLLLSSLGNYLAGIFPPSPWLQVIQTRCALKIMESMAKWTHLITEVLPWVNNIMMWDCGHQAKNKTNPPTKIQGLQSGISPSFKVVDNLRVCFIKRNHPEPTGWKPSQMWGVLVDKLKPRMSTVNISFLIQKARWINGSAHALPKETKKVSSILQHTLRTLTIASKNS